MVSRLINSVEDWISSLNNSTLIIEDKRSEITVSGRIRVAYYYEGLEDKLSDEFNIKIHIYKDYPLTIPDIEELDGKIPKEFHMNDIFFCLGVPLEMLMYAKNHSIEQFLNRYLNSYLMSFMYYYKYGICPYGDRSHGSHGKLEHLKEYFQEQNDRMVFKLLKLTINEKVGRNEKCVCGSGKKYKRCHLNTIENLKMSIDKKELVSTYEELIRFVKNKNTA